MPLSDMASTLLALSIPATFFVARFFVSETLPLRTARRTTVVTGALALLYALLPHGGPDRDPLVHHGVATKAVVALVCMLAFVIARFSQSYLHRDPGSSRYARNFLSTLAGVTTLLVTNNLLVLSFAWTASSLSLHQLLTFYPERAQALLAAQKKFVLSRIADASMLVANMLIAFSVRSLDLTVIADHFRSATLVPEPIQLAAILIVVAVSLKSAQLPFHGWLTQVMEAPTPVSALLHAGVVNIGGFVLIRLAPLMACVPSAQVALVCVGSTTAVVSSLVMTTRVSVKLQLAWSTCAQMGFMLVECGLGLWQLALIHIVAHSFYKAHAFLSAGEAVGVWRTHQLAAAANPGSMTRRAGALKVAMRVGMLVGLYVAVHLFVAPQLGEVGSPKAQTSVTAWVLAGVALASLIVTHGLLRWRPRGAFSEALQTHLFAGLYLDDIFTRATVRLLGLLPAKTDKGHVHATGHESPVGARQ